MKAAQKVRASGMVRQDLKQRFANVQSFEDRKARRDAAKETRFLTEEEVAELRYVWGGFGEAVGCRSPMGAIIEMVLRAPPADRPLWERIEVELRRFSGLMSRYKLEGVLSAEGVATRQEVRLAIESMRDADLVACFTDEWPAEERADQPEGTRPLVPTPLVRQVQTLQRQPPPRYTPEERWAREDEELRVFAEGYIDCKETHAKAPERDSDRLHTGLHQAAAERAMAVILGRDRVILERVYGSGMGRSSLPHLDVFGLTLAAVVPYTPVVEEARQALVERKIAERRDALDLARATMCGKWRKAIDDAEEAVRMAPEALFRLRLVLSRANDRGEVPAHEGQKAIDAIESVLATIAKAAGDPKPKRLFPGQNLPDLAESLIDEAERLLAHNRRVPPPRIVPDEDIAEVVECEVDAEAALDAMLDGLPLQDPERILFVARAKAQAEKLLEGVCNLYRLAKRC